METSLKKQLTEDHVQQVVAQCKSIRQIFAYGIRYLGNSFQGIRNPANDLNLESSLWNPESRGLVFQKSRQLFELGNCVIVEQVLDPKSFRTFRETDLRGEG